MDRVWDHDEVHEDFCDCDECCPEYYDDGKGDWEYERMKDKEMDRKEREERNE